MNVDKDLIWEHTVDLLRKNCLYTIIRDYYLQRKAYDLKSIPEEVKDEYFKQGAQKFAGANFIKYTISLAHVEEGPTVWKEIHQKFRSQYINLYPEEKSILLHDFP